MKLFLTGATGALGRPVVPALVAAGHDVRAVARDDIKAAQVRDAGAEAVRIDLFDRAAVREAVAGSEAILHLATNVPPLSKAGFLPAWRTHNRLRTEVTDHLLVAARDHGIRRFVKESITFTYPDRGDEWIDESVVPDAQAKALAPTLVGEEMVERFTRDGADGVVLRFGLFSGAETRMVDEALRLARARMAVVVGSPRSYMSSIHVDDAAQAVVAAISADPGIYNVVDDEPVTRREYVDAFAAAFDLPHLRIAPAWALRGIGGSAAKALTASQRVANGKFRSATGWAPAYRSAREGWGAIGADDRARIKREESR